MSGADPFVGEVALYPYSFVPSGWASCDGQLLPISSNTALFSILGTTYGGDGKSTFALPNLNGRAALAPGQGNGLSPYDLGDQGGEETVTLLASQMPLHAHATLADPGAATSRGPVDSVPAAGTVALHTAAATVSEPLGTSGGNQPHNNMQPSLRLRYCIALTGVFPQRS